jgi:hypothetical protein
MARRVTHVSHVSLSRASSPAGRARCHTRVTLEWCSALRYASIDHGTKCHVFKMRWRTVSGGTWDNRETRTRTCTINWSNDTRCPPHTQGAGWDMLYIYSFPLSLLFILIYHVTPSTTFLVRAARCGARSPPARRRLFLFSYYRLPHLSLNLVVVESVAFHYSPA